MRHAVTLESIICVDFVRLHARIVEFKFSDFIRQPRITGRNSRSLCSHDISVRDLL